MALFRKYTVSFPKITVNISVFTESLNIVYVVLLKLYTAASSRVRYSNRFRRLSHKSGQGAKHSGI